MHLSVPTWKRLAVAALALAAMPATHAQRVPDGQRFPGQRVPTPGVTDNAILPVTIEVVQSCIVSAADLQFGAYVSNSQTPVVGQTNIELNCGVGVTVEVSLDGGTSPGPKTTRRKLSQDSGPDRLDYDLYQDAGRKIHWGDRSGADTLEVLSTGALQTVPVYGEIPAGQRAREGTYSDMITVTLTY